MNPLAVFLAFASLTAAAGLNRTREYTLHTKVKQATAATRKFNNLYLTSYHTGAGLSDATFDADQDNAVKAFLNNTNAKGVGAQLFDMGTEVPWYQENDVINTAYSGWQPVLINVGSGTPKSVLTFGFFVNDTGLQWTSTPKHPGSAVDSFGGWLVCKWWHGVPQLFVRIAGYNTPAPASCVDVDLVPTYL